MQETLDWLYAQPRGLRRPNLEPIQHAAHVLNIPTDKQPIIHVAGTNGKGSTTAYMNAILQAHGKHVACFTSPHIHCINERMTYNSQVISDEEWINIVNQIQQSDLQLAQFEIMTLAFFMFIQERKVDYVILEAGIGGLLDTTNFIESSVSVITTVDFDHTDILGNTIEEITYQKAGIIKSDSPVFVGRVSEISRQIISDRAAYYHATATFIDADRLDANGVVMLEKHPIEAPITGVYQKDNLQLALNVCTFLLGNNLLLTAVQDGLSKVYWPARFETVCHTPEIIVDGAHNLHGITGLIQTLQLPAFRHKKITVLFGALPKKDYQHMLKALQQHYPVYFTQFNYFIPLHASQYDIPEGVEVIDDYRDWVKRGVLSGALDCLIVTGSLYFVSEFKEFVESELKSFNLL